MEFHEGWRLLPLPETAKNRRLPVYGWAGLAVMVMAEILLFLRVEPVYTNATPILWIAYIALIDAWTYKRAGRSFFHPSYACTPQGKRMLAVMLPASVIWWLFFEFVNCYLENWHYIGLPDNPTRYAGYLVAFATITPGILCTAELLLTFRLFQDRGIMKSFDIWSQLEVSVSVPLVSDRRKPIPLTGRFLFLSMLISAFAVSLPMLLPWRDIRWYLFAPVWVGYIYLLEPLLYKYGAPSLFRAWERRRTRSIAAYLVSGVICGLLWEFWNFWAGAKWLYTVPFTETWRYFEMPVLGFLGFIPFAWECYALFSLSLLLCGQIKVNAGIQRKGKRAAWILVTGLGTLCLSTYFIHPNEFFRLGHLPHSMPGEQAMGETQWTTAIHDVEQGKSTPETLLHLAWQPDNHTDSDLRILGKWLRNPDPQKRRAANLTLRARSVASRFAWANRGLSADDLSHL